jgi:glycine/D-amino acid oxidase-like deaminating enzyme
MRRCMARPTIERPFWLDTVDRGGETDSRRVPSTDLPDRADVTIIGAGFTGLAAALALAKRGARVVVLEAHDIAWGASSRNGGMVLTGLKRPVEWLVAKFGVERARDMFRASTASVDRVEQLVEQERIDCNFARCGHVEVACKPRHLEQFRRTARTLTEIFDHSTFILAREELPSEVASSRYHGALVDERSARINPARFAMGLARSARERGALVAEQTPVTSIARRSIGSAPAPFTVMTERGEVRSDSVLLATGAYTGSTAPSVRGRFVALGSYIIVTEPLDASLAAQLIPRGRMVFDSNNFLHYYRLTPDRRMLFGGRAAFSPADERTVHQSASILRRGMTDVFPQLRDAAIEYAWGGSIDVAFDMLPHAGAIDGLHYAIGYAGHGVAMATYAGERMAAAIAGEAGGAADALPFGPLPKPPPGLSGAAPWFLPLAGAWYRLLDWAS